MTLGWSLEHPLGILQLGLFLFDFMVSRSGWHRNRGVYICSQRILEFYFGMRTRDLPHPSRAFLPTELQEPLRKPSQSCLTSRVRGNYCLFCTSCRTPPGSRLHVGMLACKTPNQGVESSFCHWIAWPSLAEKNCFFTDTKISLRQAVRNDLKREL